MIAKNINNIRSKVRRLCPLVHCITNPISINQCANAVLAVGARPIMAEHPDEVSEITLTAQSLMLNLGNISDTRMKSIMLSAMEASKNNIPFVIDVVGIACSQLRRSFANELIAKSHPTLIKGNYSEIYALANPAYKAAGVDAEALHIEAVAKSALMLSQRLGAILLASGKTDIITDGVRIIYVKNGTKHLSSVTGTGCMLGALCSAYFSVCTDINAVVSACAVMGICGELAKTDAGSGSFSLNLMDKLSTLTDAEVEKFLNLEEVEIEKI